MRALNYDRRAFERDRRLTLDDVRRKACATIEPVAPWMNDLFALVCVLAFIGLGVFGLSLFSYLIGGHVS